MSTPPRPPPIEMYILRDSEQNVMSAAFLLPIFAPGESLELLHGPSRESPGKPVRLTSPSLFSQGSGL